MSILTKAAAPVKGTATLFTLDKVALAAVTSVAADAYFSDSANWKSVSLLYHSSVGNQHKTVKFDASQSSPTSKFLLSTKSKDIFEIRNIVIKDFDRGTLKILRSQLTTTEFDVNVAAVDTATTTISWTPLSDYVLTGNGGFTSTNTSGSTSAIILDNNPIDTSQNFEITYSFTSIASPTGSGFIEKSFIGYMNSTLGYSGLFSDDILDKRQKFLTNNSVAVGSPEGNFVAPGSHVLKITKSGSSLFFTLDNNILLTLNASVLPDFIKPAVRLMGYVTMTSATVTQTVIPIEQRFFSSTLHHPSWAIVGNTAITQGAPTSGYSNFNKKYTDTGKFYAEFLMSNTGYPYYVGAGLNFTLDSNPPNFIDLLPAGGTWLGFVGVESGQTGIYTAATTTGYVVNHIDNNYNVNGRRFCICLDLDNKKAYFGIDGVYSNSSNPETGTGGFAIAAQSSDVTARFMILNHGTTANFAYQSSPIHKPTGFQSI